MPYDERCHVSSGLSFSFHSIFTLTVLLFWVGLGLIAIISVLLILCSPQLLSYPFLFTLDGQGRVVV